MKPTKKNIRTLAGMILEDDQAYMPDPPWKRKALNEIPFHEQIRYETEAIKMIRIINEMNFDVDMCIEIGKGAFSDALKLIEKEI